MTFSTSTVTSEESVSTEAPTILLLDDDSTTLLVLHTILEGTDAHIIECEDETSAVHMSEQVGKPIDLVVADVVLQDTNGPAVVRRIKRSHPLARLLFISGFNVSELHKRGLLSPKDLAEGSAEFLQKPFSSEEFIARVNKLL